MKWPALEFAICQLAYNGDAVAPVQGDGRQIENRCNGCVRTQPDQVDQHGESREQPHAEHRSIGFLPDFVPDPAEGQHFVTGVGPDGAGACLDGRHGGEVEHDICTDGEEDAAAAADDFVEDLCHRLYNGRLQLVERITHCVSEDNGEEPAADPGEA